MSTISRVKTWNIGDTLTASDLNAEFNNILNDYNGSVSNVNVSGSAAIDDSKISFTKPYFQGSYQAMTTDVDAEPVTFNLSLSNIHTLTLGGNRTLKVSNATVGQMFLLRLIQDGTGNRTVTWDPSNFGTIKWPSATAPTLSTTAGSVDVFAFLCTSSGNWDGYFVGFDLRSS